MESEVIYIKDKYGQRVTTNIGALLEIRVTT